jgi:hypothetical protein
MAQILYHAVKGQDADFAAVTVDSLSVNGNTVAGGLLLGESEVVDLNGIADALVIDADGDTTISSPTDDQIDIKIAGADDFRFTANTFTALSGSTIAANTIAETTPASGVTIDSVLLKDGISTARTPVVVVSADGAISVPNGNTVYMVTKAGVAAMTLVDPTAGTHDGLILTFVSTGAHAHTIDLVTGINGGAADVGTFGGAAGDSVSIVAYAGVWYEMPGANTNVTFA